MVHAHDTDPPPSSFQSSHNDFVLLRLRPLPPPKFDGIILPQQTPPSAPCTQQFNSNGGSFNNPTSFNSNGGGNAALPKKDDYGMTPSERSR